MSGSGSSGCARACTSSSNSRTRFLRHVSHELKTPLTAVREGAELLRDNVAGRLTPEQQEIVRIVRENTLSLQKLIEDLLTYHQSRALESATLGPVPLPDVVRRVLREQKLAGLGAHDHVETAAGAVDRGGRRPRAHPHHRRQPAVERDQVFAALRRHRDHARRRQDGFAVLDVADHGPGIAPAERDRVFDSFYSGKPPLDGKVKGSGLGLAIAREYALAQSAAASRCSIANDGARGVRFRLCLPVARGAGRTWARAGRTSAPVTIGGAR